MLINHRVTTRSYPFILDSHSKPKTADHMDQLISAEIPDQTLDPQ
jgi:hypothetical protein